MSTETNDLALRKLRNQWAKERAVLEQQNHLLSMNLLEVKHRESSLKRVNNALVHSIDLGKQSSAWRLQSKIARLEEENKQLKVKLVETSMEKKQIEEKEYKLRVDHACMRQRTASQLKEAKKAKEQYLKQLSKLERKFERLRFSNDHLMEAFRNSMLATKNEEIKDDKCRCGGLGSGDSSDVVICSECIEEDGSDLNDGKCLHGLKSSRQPSSSRKSRATCGKHKPTRDNSTIELSIPMQNMRNIHEMVKQQGGGIGNLSTRPVSQTLHRSSATILPLKTSSSRADLNVKRQTNAFSRTNTESEYIANAHMFKHKRKSTVGFLGSINKPLKLPLNRGETDRNVNQIEFQLEEDQPLQRRPSFLNTANLKSLEERAGDHPPRSMRMDYSCRLPNDSDLRSLQLRDEPNVFEPNPRLSGCQDAQSARDQMSVGREKLGLTQLLGSSIKRTVRRREDNKENCPEMSTRLSNSNIFRSMNVRESVQDCLNFNEVLREKLANIEQKLKLKVAN